MFNLMDKKKIAILCKLFLLNLPYASNFLLCCTYFLGIKDLFNVEYICYVPGVFGKCPQWQSIFPHEHGGEVWQAFLLVTGGYPLLETFKEELGGMEHQGIRISCNIKSYCINSKFTATFQSELLRPIPLNQTSDVHRGSTLLKLHYVTLMSQKPCQHNNKCDCSKTNGYK